MLLALPGILDAGGFFIWTKVIWLLVLEHCTGGDLFDYVRVSWPSAAPEKKNPPRILLHMSMSSQEPQEEAELNQV